ncbi:MAG: hypothetical protein CM15mP96_1240 [Gammaproteobacteria bacterium]|nr:MAG: hypothetical protein CM15mP96_1240 [Gammaproteobacteria bacterium]
MMTTGYDCTDLLNIAMMRPIYSPSEFIQMKGPVYQKEQILETVGLMKTQINESIDSEKKKILHFLTSLEIINILKKNLIMIKIKTTFRII